MDGKNSSGRKISLLNEDTASVPLYHSRTSSLNSTPCLSPRTPLLIRSESADSAIMQTPSPITPDLTYDGLGISHQGASPVFSESSFFPQTKSIMGYPPVQQANGPLPYPPVIAAPVQQPLPQSPPQAAGFYAPQASTSTERRSSGQPKSKKNSYPCPMAKQFNCNDYFTTSGHAARHAKKHTGKKDAFCPECNKAFTRKDNMEQHRRTHQNGRGASKNGDDKGKRVKQAAKQRKQEIVQPQMLVDPTLPISPTATYGYAVTLPMVDPYAMDFSGVGRNAYPDPTQFAQQPVQPIMPGEYTHQRSPSYALDALAIAASGENVNN